MKLAPRGDGLSTVQQTSVASKASLNHLRQQQTFGMSLKKAVRLGFVVLAHNVDDGSVQVVKRTKIQERTRA